MGLLDFPIPDSLRRLLKMIDKAEGEDTVTIKLDGWVKRDKNNNRMVSLKVNTYVKPTQAKDPWDD